MLRIKKKGEGRSISGPYLPFARIPYSIVAADVSRDPLPLSIPSPPSLSVSFWKALPVFAEKRARDNYRATDLA